jgi:hypothetical protein
VIAHHFGLAGLGALAGFLTMTSIAAEAAPSPNPAALRATLADPISQDFVEADQGTPGTVEGSLDATRYVDSTSATAAERQGMLDSLNRNGFISGYGREWYKPRSNDFLGELVLAFTNPNGARATASLSKIRYAQDKGFQSFTDSLIPGGYALTEVASGYSWTVVVFTKADGMYAVAGGSPSDFMSADVLAQAQKEYRLAPANTLAPSHQTAPIGFALALLLVLLITGGLVLFAVIRRRPSASTSSQQ